MPVILYVLLLLLSLIWGSSFYFIKIIVEASNPWAVTFLRCLFGALFLLIYILYKKRWFHYNKVPWFKLILIGIANSAIPWTLIAYSETMLTSSLTSVLNAFAPIWTLIVGVLFFQSKSTSLQWIGVLTGFIGIFILSEISWGFWQDASLLGFIAMMVTTFCYAWAAHFSKKYLQQIPVEWIAFGTLLSGVLVSGGGMIFSGQIFDPQILVDPSILFAVVGLGVFGSGLAYIIFYTILQRGTAEFAILVTYLVPPFAIILGVGLLQEPIGWRLFVGLIFILSGVYIAGRHHKLLAKLKSD